MSAAESPRFFLQTFGALSLRTGSGDAIAAPRRKPLTLLAVVAAHGATGISRERLLLLLWPESTPDRARQSLNQALYALRADLGIEPVTGTTHLHLAAEIEADITGVRAALGSRACESAMTTIDAGFLEGISFPGAVEFDQWVDQQRQSLSADLKSAMLARARERSALSHPDAIADWQQLGTRYLADALVIHESARALARDGHAASAVRLLHAHVHHLRREFEVEPDTPIRLLEQDLRAMLAAGDRPLASSASPHGPDVSVPPDVATQVDTMGVDRPRHRRWWHGRPWRKTVVSAATAVSLLAVTQLPSVRTDRTDEVPETALLVTPFRFDGPEDRSYLARGIAEEVALRLQPVSGIQLLPPSVIRGADTLDVRAAAERLGAEVMLEGSVKADVTSAGVTMRVISRLVSVADGHVLWSWAGDGQLDRTLALQTLIADSTANRVVRALNQSSFAHLQRPATADADAYDLYLRAMDYVRRGREGLPQARELLAAAIARDSQFVAALARYGEVQARMNWHGYDRDSLRMANAQRLIQRAIAIDPLSIEAHLADAYWWLYDRRAYTAALTRLDRVLTLSQNNAEALAARAQIRRRLGRWEEAAGDYAAALRNDPSSYPLTLELGNTLLLMRRYEEARRHLERARILAPDATDPVAWLAALAIREKGDTAAALRVLTEGLRTVNPHSLYARVLLSFPEVYRILGGRPFEQVSDVSLQDAYGDTASLHLLQADRARGTRERHAHLDTAIAIYRGRVARAPDSFAAFRNLALAMSERGVDGALNPARQAVRLMPIKDDAMAGALNMMVLAQVEAVQGIRDSSEAHIRALLRAPSPISAAAMKLDPIWRRGERHNTGI